MESVTAVASATAALPHKRCPRCGETKSLSDFHACRRKKDGRQPRCKACACALRAQWRDRQGQLPENKAAARERTKKWREQNPERWRASNKKWCEANAERQRDGVRRFRVRNPNYERDRYAASPGLCAAYAAARRARVIKATPPWANQEAIFAFYEKAKRHTVETGVPHHVDHIIPLRGKNVCGLHVETNLQILTGSENSRKGNRFVAAA